MMLMMIAGICGIITCALISVGFYVYFIQGKSVARTIEVYKVIFFTVPLLILSAVLPPISTKKNGSVENVATDVYTIEYLSPPPIGCSCVATIVRRNGKLLMFNAPPVEYQTLEQVDELGEVDVIVVPHEGHASNQGDWLKQYPRARVCAPRKCRAKLESKVNFPIVCDLEDALVEYNITMHSPPHGVLSVSDSVLEVRLVDDNRVLIFQDIQVNFVAAKKQSRFLKEMGFGGWLRTARFFQVMFVRDPMRLRYFLQHTIARIPNVTCVIYSHGGARFSDKPGRLSRDIAYSASQTIVM